jgi:ferredoxin-type protein NapH
MKITKFFPMFLFIIIFYSIAISFSIIFKSTFYLVNFIIIGTSIALGIGLWPILPKIKKDFARKLSQILVGSYMFFGLGLGFFYITFGRIRPENMQLEGFFFYLSSGLFQAAVMHYTIAKIIGPFIFGRMWCGWTCWTAAVLDLLPFKNPAPRINKKFELIRYIFFAISILIVFVLVYIFKYTNDSIAGIIDLAGNLKTKIQKYDNYFLIPEFWWFITGNFIYYISGIVLAFILKDNRAFCKYMCPITLFLKIGSRFSLLKIKTIKDKCIDCKICEKTCPMNIEITQYVQKWKRILSTECILCNNCVRSCSKEALKLTAGFDFGFKEYLIRK